MKSPKRFLIFALSALSSTAAFAHCDGWDGPVVLDAQKALAKGDVNLVLPWVRKVDEPAIREAFSRTLEVRNLGGAARKLSEQFFFETLVRLHRAGEGASFTGLKPAGLELGPAIKAGDKALETGDIKPVWTLLSDTVHAGLHQRFEAAQKAKSFKPEDIEGGRRYVAAYVNYIHYVEGLHEAAGPISEKASSGETSKPPRSPVVSSNHQH